MHFRFLSHLVAIVRFPLLQQVFFIYVLTLVFFTLPCCTEPQVVKVNQSGWLYMPECICNLMELTIHHTENVRESRSTASLNNPERTCNAFGQTTLSCDLLSNFTTMERSVGGTHVSHLRGWQYSHHQSTRASSSSSRLNGILNMSALTLWAAIKHLEEFFPSNYIYHCQPFSGNRDWSPQWHLKSEWCHVEFIINYSVINSSQRTFFG